jgi:hypothetical protein
MDNKIMGMTQYKGMMMEERKYCTIYQVMQGQESSLQ